MKTLLFLCGPNGIGKTTISKELLAHLPHSAYVDSDPCRMMNPFVLNDDTIPTIRKNISGMILNYFHCKAVETVIFSYGFHGRRKEIFEGVLEDLSSFPYDFKPFLLTCNESENIKRMQKDHRDSDRIQRTLEISRKAYEDNYYPTIDISAFTVEEAAFNIILKAGLNKKTTVTN